MKLNWGTAIAIFYTCFVIAMVSMVIKSTHHKPHMVQDNYYEKDLNYEAFRQKRENASQMQEQVLVDYLSAEQLIRLSFPKSTSEISGKIAFFRPSNSKLDKTFALELDQDAQMNIPVSPNMLKGLWKVQINWEQSGQHFYKESTVVL